MQNKVTSKCLWLFLCICVCICTALMTFAAEKSSKSPRTVVKETKIYTDLSYDESVPEGLEYDHSGSSNADLLNSHTIAYSYTIYSDGTKSDIRETNLWYSYGLNSERRAGVIRITAADEEEYQYVYYLYNADDKYLEVNTIDPVSGEDCLPCKIYAYSGNDYTITTVYTNDISAVIESYDGSQKAYQVEVGRDTLSSESYVTYEYNDDDEVISESRPSGLADGTSVTSVYENVHSSEGLLTDSVVTYTEGEAGDITSASVHYEYYPDGKMYRRIKKTAHTDGSTDVLTEVFLYTDKTEAKRTFRSLKGDVCGILYLSAEQKIPYYDDPFDDTPSGTLSESFTTAAYDQWAIGETTWYQILVNGELKWVNKQSGDQYHYISFNW